MNFSKSFSMSPEMRNILPAQNNRKPTRNFLAENIKNLRGMQQQMEATKKAMEAKAKKVQKPSQRSPYTITKGINKPLWVKYSPVSEENASGSGGSGYSQNVAESKAKTLPAKHFIDQGVQTSPDRKRTDKEDEESSTNSTYSTHPSLILTKPSPSQQPQKKSLPVNNEAASMKEKAINKIWKETGVNFVELNRRMEYKRKATKEKSDPTGIPPNYQLGELPRYLKEKKKANPELAKKTVETSLDLSEPEEQRPGYILLSDEERLEHLKMMNKCYEELLLQFNQLPIRCDSLRAKQKRADLEKQLDNLEKSMKLFSREKLYIKL